MKLVNSFKKKRKKKIKIMNIFEDKNDKIIQEKNEKEKKDSDDNIFRENDKYLTLDNYKIYYFVCPDCRCRIPHIETIQYKIQKNDFIIEYNCQCNCGSKKSDLFYLLATEQPLNICINHYNN